MCFPRYANWKCWTHLKQTCFKCFFVEANCLCFWLVLQVSLLLDEQLVKVCRQVIFHAISCQSNHKEFFSAALWISVQPVSAKDNQQLLTNWTESSVNGCLTVVSRSLGLCDSWAMSYQIKINQHSCYFSSACNFVILVFLPLETFEL